MFLSVDVWWHAWSASAFLFRLTLFDHRRFVNFRSSFLFPLEAFHQTKPAAKTPDWKQKLLSNLDISDFTAD